MQERIIAMSHFKKARDNQDGKSVAAQPFGGILPSIFISAVLPLAVYLLASPHMSTLAALTLMAIPPVLYSVYSWIRAHSIDLISIITLFTIVISMLIALLLHDSHLLLLRDSYLTGAFGLLCLLSLLSSKPAAYYLYKWAFVRTPEQLATLNARWQLPYVRFVRRLVTVVWGLVFIGETLTDTYFVYHLPTKKFVAIHPFLFWGVMVAAFGWATLYSRYAQNKVAILEQTT